MFSPQNYFCPLSQFSRVDIGKEENGPDQGNDHKGRRCGAAEERGGERRREKRRRRGVDSRPPPVRSCLARKDRGLPLALGPGPLSSPVLRPESGQVDGWRGGGAAHPSLPALSALLLDSCHNLHYATFTRHVSCQHVQICTHNHSHSLTRAAQPLDTPPTRRPGLWGDWVPLAAPGLVWERGTPLAPSVRPERPLARGIMRRETDQKGDGERVGGVWITLWGACALGKKRVRYRGGKARRCV